MAIQCSECGKEMNSPYICPERIVTEIPVEFSCSFCGRSAVLLYKLTWMPHLTIADYAIITSKPLIHWCTKPIIVCGFCVKHAQELDMFPRPMKDGLMNGIYQKALAGVSLNGNY